MVDTTKGPVFVPAIIGDEQGLDAGVPVVHPIKKMAPRIVAKTLISQILTGASLPVFFFSWLLREPGSSVAVPAGEQDRASVTGVHRPWRYRYSSRSQ
jgi:hypothetical protein